MKKRILALILTASMIISLAACGTRTSEIANESKDNSEADSTASEASSDTTAASVSDVSQLEHEELTIVFPYMNAAPKDTAMIEEALSSIAEEKINASIKLQPIAYGSWQEQFNLLMSNSDEKMDVIFTGLNNTSLSSMVSKGYLIELDGYLGNVGAPTAEVVGDYIRGGQVAGQTYSIPTLRDLATSSGVMFLKSYIDKYNIDTESIDEWSDLTEVLKTIKEGEGDAFTPMFLNGSQYTSLTSTFSDPLGDSLGTLAPNTDDTVVVNRFATEEYKELVALIKSWYDAGYINKDAATTTALWQEAAQAGTSACWPNNMKPGQVENQANMIGQEMIGIHIGEDVVTTASLQTAMWSIPYQAQDPERSMMLLNLMYTDADFFNTLNWGIEGTHFVKTDDGHITFPDGVDANSSGWYLNLGWVFGNQFLSYFWTGNDMDLWERTKEYNDSAKLSPAAGFVFDTTNVKNEYAACQSVKEEFVRAIETGSQGLDKVDEMNAKLEASGIQKIIDEKQRQLDEFLGK
ncbi:extracellular solute-binding protein [Eisenbergiella sp.]